MTEYVLSTIGDDVAVRKSATDLISGMDGVLTLLDDDEVEAVHVNGCDRVFVRYASGARAQVPPIASTDAELEEMVRRLAVDSGSDADDLARGNPTIGLRLADGSRLFAVMARTPGERPSLSIQRYRHRPVDLPHLRTLGMLDTGLCDLMRALVRACKNVLITGPTMAGKTTLLRALTSAVDPSERLVVIEDVPELGLEHDPMLHPDAIALRTRDAAGDGTGAISQADLLRWAPRLLPDRLIIDEIGGADVVAACNALSQGNDGSMATLRASSSRTAFTFLAGHAAREPERLPQEAANLLIASAVHFVVHLAHAADGTRVVSSVHEVTGADERRVVSTEIYRPGSDRRATPNSLPSASTLDDLRVTGFDPGTLVHGISGSAL